MSANNNNLLISVVTPVYNYSKYIEECIKSVITQSCRNEFEYIIMDGASDDGTKDIIEKYSDEIDYWISEPDKGQSHALNKAIRKAKGKYIFWVNGDDQLYDGIMDKITPYLKNLDNKTTIYGNLVILRDNKLTDLKSSSPDELNFDNLLNGTPEMLINATIYPKKLFLDSGFFWEDYHFSFDYELYLRLVKNYKLQYLDLPFVVFRKHDEAKSSKDWLKFIWETWKITRYYNGKIICKRTYCNLYKIGQYYKRKLKNILKVD